MALNKTFALGALAVAATAALATLPAMAQTSVTISGVIDVGVNSMTMPNYGTGSGTVRTNSMVGGGLETSYLQFAGVEDMGGGMKAGFTLGSFFQPNDGQFGRTFLGNGSLPPQKADTLFSRDANVWLSGDAGKLELGKQISPLYLSTLLFDPFSGSFDFSPIVYQTYATFGGGNEISADTGYSNAISYSTPNFNGLSAEFLYSLSGQNGAKNSFSANALYFNGPLAATLVYENSTVGSANNTFVAGGDYASGTTQNVTQFGISYDLNPLKLFFQAQRNSTNNALTAIAAAAAALNTNNGTFDTYQLGATYTIGQGKVLASYAHTGGAVDHKTFSIGYDYNLSKRTDIYTAFMQDQAPGYAVSTGDDTFSSFSVGIRHHF